MPNTSWIAEGATVAEYDARHMDNRVTFTTVERLTATQIICATGNRFYRETGRIVGGDRIELQPVNNQGVRDTVALRQVEILRWQLSDMCKDVRGGEAAMLAILDQLEQAIAEARAVIADPTRT